MALHIFAGGCAAAGSEPSALIPIATFFANRQSNYAYRVSFDGRRLAWLASAGGRMTVHVRELDGGDVRVLGTPSSRSPSTFWWAADSRHVLWPAITEIYSPSPSRWMSSDRRVSSSSRLPDGSCSTGVVQTDDTRLAHLAPTALHSHYDLALLIVSDSCARCSKSCRARYSAYA